MVENLFDFMVQTMNIDRSHAEDLAKTYLILLNDEFNIQTVGYSVFLIMNNIYRMVDSQNHESAMMFKQMMCDLSKELGEH